MRATFVRTLVELAEEDERIVLLTGDLGFTVLEPFAERFPDRFFNVGVAEQNMVGIATGLAEAGSCRSSTRSPRSRRCARTSSSATARCCTICRCAIVGVGGGLDYGHNGVTHYALEDMRSCAPSPGWPCRACRRPQARAALVESRAVPGPVYFRLGKNETETVPGLDGRFALGARRADRRRARRRDRRRSASIAHQAVARRRAPGGAGDGDRVLVVAACRARRRPTIAGGGARAASRSRSRSRRTTSTAGSARSSPRSSPSTGLRLPRRALRGRGPPGVGRERSVPERRARPVGEGDRADCDRGPRPTRPWSGRRRRPMKQAQRGHRLLSRCPGDP